MRCIHFTFIYCLFCLSLFAEPLPLGDVMTPEEQQATGLSHVTDAERAAFEVWIGKWTKKVLDHSGSYSPSLSLRQWMYSWPGFETPAQRGSTPQDIAELTKANQVISRITNAGEYVYLKNGSVWHISPSVSYYVSLWTPGDRIQVSQAASDVFYPYRLFNISRSDPTRPAYAAATLVQQASPTGQAAQKGPAFYAGAKRITYRSTLGEYVYLEDGTRWRIAPVGQQYVQTWNLNDRVRVGPSNDAIYTNTLTDLDNGGIVQAKPAID